jgi:hypothetical protein
MKTLTLLLIVGLLIAGCEDAAVMSQAPPVVAPQAMPPAGPVAIPEGYALAVPGSEHQLTDRVQTPATSSYMGEGVRINREVTHARIFTPFGPAPGETLSKQQPSDFKRAGSPAVAVTPAGTVAAQGGASEFKGGGGNWSLWDTIKQRLHDWSFGIIGIGLLVLVGGAALWFLVPAVRPAISWILRALASIPPFIGSIIENARGKAKVAEVVKPLVEVIDGGQKFKTLLKEDATLGADGKPVLSQAAKDLVLKMFVAGHAEAQDGPTKDVVVAVKEAGKSDPVPAIQAAL